jgi:hypothetical protein
VNEVNEARPRCPRAGIALGDLDHDAPILAAGMQSSLPASGKVLCTQNAGKQHCHHTKLEHASFHVHFRLREIPAEVDALMS